MSAVFGVDAGVGTRSAVGVNALPMGVIVEIEGVFELHDWSVVRLLFLIKIRLN